MVTFFPPYILAASTDPTDPHFGQDTLTLAFLSMAIVASSGFGVNRLMSSAGDLGITT